MSSLENSRQAGINLLQGKKPMKPSKEQSQKIEPNSALIQAADRAFAKKHPEQAAILFSHLKQVQSPLKNPLR
jgi:hypothetical protein